MLNEDVCRDCYGCEWFVGGECEGKYVMCTEYESVNIDGRERG